MMIPRLKHLKPIKQLQTYPIIRPLKIPIHDILLPPRPLITQPISLLNLQQELLDLFLKLPKRGTTIKNVLTRKVQVHVQAAKGVKGSVITAEVGGVLLVTLALVDVVGGVVVVGD